MEYRKPLGDFFRLKVGINMEEYNHYSSSPNVVSVTDTTVFYNRRHSGSSQIGLRIGAERQLKSSIFSIGADINIHYRSRYRMQWNEVSVLTESGNWVDGMIVTEEGDLPHSQDHVSYNYHFVVGESGYANVRDRFLVPSVRTALNMDLPLSRMFTLHLSAAASFGLPIYMGISSEYDPNNRYEGIPATTFEFDTNAIIGVRYNIGEFRKKRAEKKAAG